MMEKKTIVKKVNGGIGESDSKEEAGVIAKPLPFQFLEKDPSLTEPVIMSLLRFVFHRLDHH